MSVEDDLKDAAIAAVQLVEAMDRAMRREVAAPVAEPGPVANAKQLSTLQAEYALAGVQLVPLADGTFVAAQGGWLRNLAGLDDAAAWLRKVTGKPA